MTALRSFLAERRPRAVTVVALLVVMWGVPPLLPEELGLSFGVPYRIFFTALVIAAALFFELLRSPAAAPPPTGRGVFAGIALVYGLTVGGIVAIGQVYPQFDVPRLRPGQTALSPEERGHAIFWDRAVACFACHAVAGTGGRRAPDMAGIAGRAATRKPGVAAEEYIRLHIAQGSAYALVPGYQPIMPPFGQRLTAGQIDDLVAYLLSLK